MEPEPVAEVVDVPAVEVAADDDWSGFTTGKKKKVSGTTHRSLCVTGESLMWRARLLAPLSGNAN